MTKFCTNGLDGGAIVTAAVVEAGAAVWARAKPGCMQAASASDAQPFCQRLGVISGTVLECAVRLVGRESAARHPVYTGRTMTGW